MTIFHGSRAVLTNKEKLENLVKEDGDTLDCEKTVWLLKEKQRFGKNGWQYNKEPTQILDEKKLGRLFH